MAEFTLHIRLDPDADPDGTDILDRYVEEHDAVSYGNSSGSSTPQKNLVVPEPSALEIDGVELLAKIYTDIRTHPDVAEVLLGGPNAERYPVPIQHYALQQLEHPDLYEYHALDEQVTLVIAESQLEAEKVREDVPTAALGYSQSPF